MVWSINGWVNFGGMGFTLGSEDNNSNQEHIPSGMVSLSAFTKYQVFHRMKFKAFADDSWDVAEMMIVVFNPLPHNPDF